MDGIEQHRDHDDAAAPAELVVQVILHLDAQLVAEPVAVHPQEIGERSRGAAGGEGAARGARYRRIHIVQFRDRAEGIVIAAPDPPAHAHIAGDHLEARTPADRGVRRHDEVGLGGMGDFPQPVIGRRRLRLRIEPWQRRLEIAQDGLMDASILDDLGGHEGPGRMHMPTGGEHPRACALLEHDPAAERDHGEGGHRPAQDEDAHRHPGQGAADQAGRPALAQVDAEAFAHAVAEGAQRIAAGEHRPGQEAVSAGVRRAHAEEKMDQGAHEHLSRHPTDQHERRPLGIPGHRPAHMAGQERAAADQGHGGRDPPQTQHGIALRHQRGRDVAEHDFDHHQRECQRQGDDRREQGATGASAAVLRPVPGELEQHHGDGDGGCERERPAWLGIPPVRAGESPRTGGRASGRAGASRAAWDAVGWDPHPPLAHDPGWQHTGHAHHERGGEHAGPEAHRLVRARARHAEKHTGQDAVGEDQQSQGAHDGGGHHGRCAQERGFRGLALRLNGADATPAAGVAGGGTVATGRMRFPRGLMW